MSEQQLRGARLRETLGGAATPGGERICQRAGCQHSATVTLSFRYDARQASLVDLSEHKDPAFYDLCDAHADVLIVPKGWERLDRRTPPRESAGAISDGPRQQEGARDVTRHDRMNRYAGLTAELPRLAETLGVSSDAAGPARSGRRRTPHDSDTQGAGVPPSAAAPLGAVPSLQAASVDGVPGFGDRPAASDDAPSDAVHRVGAPGRSRPFEPVTQTLLGDEIFELEGQLQMPIEPEPGGVVVALTRSRNV